MGDGVAGALAAHELLEADDDLRKAIFLHAYSLTRNLADAKELAQGAMAKAIDPAASPWDPDEQPSLKEHLGSLVNSAVANRRRGERRHPLVPYERDKDLRVDPTPTVEQRMVQEDEVAELKAEMVVLRTHLAGDTIALGKIDLLYRGIDDAATQAEHLKCTVADIRRANVRITYHVERIKEARGRTAPTAPESARAPEPTPSETEVGS
jgi:hypothetical protein